MISLLVHNTGIGEGGEAIRGGHFYVIEINESPKQSFLSACLFLA
jgi:hypothetical protein